MERCCCFFSHMTLSIDSKPMHVSHTSRFFRAHPPTYPYTFPSSLRSVYPKQHIRLPTCPSFPIASTLCTCCMYRWGLPPRGAGVRAARAAEAVGHEQRPLVQAVSELARGQ